MGSGSSRKTTPPKTELAPPSEHLKQKAEEFWNEIKDIEIPDVTKGSYFYHSSRNKIINNTHCFVSGFSSF